MRSRVIVGAAIVAAVVALLLVWRGHGRDGTHATVVGGSAGTAGHGGSAGAQQGSAAAWFERVIKTRHRIAGIVVGEDGAPIAGATVRVASVFTMARPASAPHTTTGADGTFELGPQIDTSYIVTAEVPKLTAALVRVDLRDPLASPPSDKLRLVVHPCTASIHGTVLDTAEGAIGGASVARYERGQPTGVAVTADDKGAFELCLPPGGTEVVVSADGYGAISERVDVFGRMRRDFQLAPATSVSGRVIRADDRSPVAGAIVQLRSADPRDDLAQLTTMAADDGTFQFDNVAPGRHLVNATGERSATREPVPVTAEVGTPTTDVVCELAATYSVSGRVVQIGTTTGLPGRSVYLVSPGSRDRWNGGPRLSSISQPDGAFTIENVQPGTYRVLTESGANSAGDHDEVTVAAADVTGVVVEVEATGSVSGRVLAGGKPVDGASVRVDRWATTSAADGSYTVRGVDEGEHELYAESQLAGAFTRDRKVSLGPGEVKTGVDIELELAGSISGVVVDQSGAPVPGVFVSFSLLRGRDFGSATTADDGSFTARALSGGGDYVYEVRPRDGSPLVLPPATGKRFPPIAVKDGQTHVTGVRIQIRYERLAISGRIVDAQGKPIADATVRAQPDDTPWFRSLSATSAENGTFSIRELTTGTYSLEATSPRGNARAEKIAAGRTDVVLRVLEPGGIDGTLDGFSGPPEVTAYREDERFVRYRGIVSGMSFQLRSLPPGQYRVVAQLAAQRASTSVEVATGAIAKARLMLARFGRITGTFLDETTRQPIAGVRCMFRLMDADDMDDSMSFANTDAKGAFTIERAQVGDGMVGCGGKARHGSARVTVTEGQEARVEITAAKPADDKGRKRHAGLTLENQLSDVLVASVEANGPAARAGVAVGDVVVSVGGEKLGRYQAELAMRLLENSTDDTIKLVIERSDKEMTVNLKLD